MNHDAKGVSIRINVGALESKPSFFFLEDHKYTIHTIHDQEIDMSCQDTEPLKA